MSDPKSSESDWGHALPFAAFGSRTALFALCVLWLEITCRSTFKLTLSTLLRQLALSTKTMAHEMLAGFMLVYIYTAISPTPLPCPEKKNKMAGMASNGVMVWKGNMMVGCVRLLEKKKPITKQIRVPWRERMHIVCGSDNTHRQNKLPEENVRKSDCLYVSTQPPLLLLVLNIHKHTRQFIYSYWPRGDHMAMFKCVV